jgi:hypothetical protein
MPNLHLHHADTFLWLREQPQDSFHACCTDPPFGIQEFTPTEIAKLRNGRGGVWRIPPKIGGNERAPLPRFTVLSQKEREHVRLYFREFALALYPVLVPGAHAFVAGTPMLQYLVQDGFADAGFEVRGAVMRIYHGFRGGDRPKNAEEEFPEVCVTPRGTYEPWMLFRKPISEKTVAANLRRWGTGGLRRVNKDQPLPDTILSGRTPAVEDAISPHPTLKPQQLLRTLVRSLLPMGKGVVLEPFAGSGSTLGACQALGYDSVGVEIDKQYFDGLRTHIQQFAKLYPLFKGESLILPLEPDSTKVVRARKETLAQAPLL